MTFQNRRLHPLFLSLLLSLAVCGCRLQLEPPKPEPSPAPAPSPVEPQPPRPDPPQPTPPQPGGDVRESEFYSALSRAVLDGEFADTDHLFAFSRYYREKHNIPPGGDVVNREFRDITTNMMLDMQSVREDIASRLQRVAEAKLKGE